MIVIGKHRYCSLVELEADAVPLVRLLDLPAWSDDSINLPSLLSRD